MDKLESLTGLQECADNCKTWAEYYRDQPAPSAVIMTLFRAATLMTGADAQLSVALLHAAKLERALADLVQAVREHNGRQTHLGDCIISPTRAAVELLDEIERKTARMNPYTEKLIAELASEIAERGLDPLSGEQLALLRGEDCEERTGMLEDMRDRVGLDVRDLLDGPVTDEERSNGRRSCR